MRDFVASHKPAALIAVLVGAFALLWFIRSRSGAANTAPAGTQGVYYANPAETYVFNVYPPTGGNPVVNQPPVPMPGPGPIPDGGFIRPPSGSPVGVASPTPRYINSGGNSVVGVSNPLASVGQAVAGQRQSVPAPILNVARAIAPPRTTTSTSVSGGGGVYIRGTNRYR